MAAPTRKQWRTLTEYLNRYTLIMIVTGRQADGLRRGKDYILPPRLPSPLRYLHIARKYSKIQWQANNWNENKTKRPTFHHPQHLAASRIAARSTNSAVTCRKIKQRPHKTSLLAGIRRMQASKERFRFGVSGVRLEPTTVWRVWKYPCQKKGKK